MAAGELAPLNCRDSLLSSPVNARRAPVARRRTRRIRQGRTPHWKKTLLRQIAEARARGRDDARPGMVEKTHRLGRLTARERLTALFDGSSFVEYGALAGATTRPEDEAYADGLIAGVGLVFGQPVCGASYDESVLGGTQSDRNRRKMAKLLYLAVETSLAVRLLLSTARARDPTIRRRVPPSRFLRAGVLNSTTVWRN